MRRTRERQGIRGGVGAAIQDGLYETPVDADAAVGRRAQEVLNFTHSWVLVERALACNGDF